MIIGHLSFTISSSFAFPAGQKLGAHTVVVMLPLGEPHKPPQRSDFNPRPKSHFSHPISLGVLGQPIPHRNSYVVTNGREHRHSCCLPIIFPLFPLPCSLAPLLPCSLVPLFLAQSSVFLIAAARTKETQTVVPLPLASDEPDELPQ